MLIQVKRHARQTRNAINYRRAFRLPGFGWGSRANFTRSGWGSLERRNDRFGSQADIRQRPVSAKSGHLREVIEIGKP
jgi:hypothetical protein